MTAVLFILASALAILGALGVVLARNPLRGAMALIVCLCAVSLHYILLEASFVASMQVLVYAGAIMVLFVFVIMMLNLGAGSSGRPFYISVWKVLGGAAAAYIFYLVLDGAGLVARQGMTVDGSVKNVGRLLLTDYLFGFEAISVLLLVAVVGAVVLGMKRLA